MRTYFLIGIIVIALSINSTSGQYNDCNDILLSDEDLSDVICSKSIELSGDTNEYELVYVYNNIEGDIIVRIDVPSTSSGSVQVQVGETKEIWNPYFYGNYTLTDSPDIIPSFSDRGPFYLLHPSSALSFENHHNLPSNGAVGFVVVLVGVGEYPVYFNLEYSATNLQSNRNSILAFQFNPIILFLLPLMRYKWD